MYWDASIDLILISYTTHFQVTNHLFKKPGARFGMDLASFNMQRGREFGLPGYMEFRWEQNVPTRVLSHTSFWNGINY